MIIQKTKKKEKKWNEHPATLAYYFLLSMLLIISFIIFHPKVSSHLLPKKQEVELNTFVKSIIENYNLDPQNYWEFREFYSPGYFEFAKDGFPKTKLSPILTKVPITLPPDTQLVLIYHSPKLISSDYITTATSTASIIATSSAKNILLRTENTLLTKQEDGSLFLFFYKTLGDMKRANGFFDYADRDKYLVEDKNWINITILNSR